MTELLEDMSQLIALFSNTPYFVSSSTARYQYVSPSAKYELITRNKDNTHKIVEMKITDTHTVSSRVIFEGVNKIYFLEVMGDQQRYVRCEFVVSTNDGFESTAHSWYVPCGVYVELKVWDGTTLLGKYNLNGEILDD